MARYLIFFALICLLHIFEISALSYDYDDRLVRKTKRRSSPRLRIPVELEGELEDSYGDIITSRPKFIEGGNQWKPMFNAPSQHSSQKYRSKQAHPQKYQQQNIIYPPEYYSKRPSKQQYSSTNLIANKTLFVADSDSVHSSKSVQKKAKHYPTHSKKHYNSSPPQYQVHEDTEDDDPMYYEAPQTRFRNQDIIVGKPKSSAQYRQQPGIKEKHIHHIHYEDNDDETLSEAANSHNHRYNPERRPDGRTYTRSSRYSSRRPY